MLMQSSQCCPLHLLYVVHWREGVLPDVKFNKVDAVMPSRGNEEGALWWGSL